MHSVQHNEVFPIRNNKTFKTPVFFEGLGKQLVIGVAWYAIHYTRIDHERKRAFFYCCLECRQVQFLHVFFWNESRGAVSPSKTCAIAYKMLEASRRMKVVYFCFFALVTFNKRNAHLSAQYRVFT